MDVLVPQIAVTLPIIERFREILAIWNWKKFESYYVHLKYVELNIFANVVESFLDSFSAIWSRLN